MSYTHQPMTFTSTELRTKTIWRSPQAPNQSIETTHLLGATKTFQVYDHQTITELHTTCECIGSFPSLKEAIDFLS